MSLPRRARRSARRARRSARRANLVLASAAAGALMLLASGSVQLLTAGPAAGAAAAGLGGLLGASPTPSVILTSPSSGGTQAFTTSSPLVSGTAVPGGQGGKGAISNVKVVISSSAGHPGTTFDLSAQAPTTGSTWTFSGSPLVPIAYNGAYSVTVTVTETDTPLLGPTTTGTSSTSTGFAEDVVPATPVGVRANVSGPDQVTVSWSANPEPDILGYVILRSSGAGAPAEIGDSPRTSTSYLDDTPKTGVSYTYSVVALRAGDSPGESLLSTPASGGVVEVSGSAVPPSSGSSASGSGTSGAGKPGSAKSASAKSGSAQSAGAKSAGAKSGSTGAGSAPGLTTIPTAPSAPSISESALAAQYKSDIAAAGKAKAPVPSAAAPASTPATSGSSTSDPSSTGSSGAGGFSEVLPYPKGQTPSGAQAAGPTAKTSSGSRARTLATVALGMIVLVIAGLAIRLALRVRRG